MLVQFLSVSLLSAPVFCHCSQAVHQCYSFRAAYSPPLIPGEERTVEDTAGDCQQRPRPCGDSFPWRRRLQPRLPGASGRQDVVASATLGMEAASSPINLPRRQVLFCFWSREVLALNATLRSRCRARSFSRESLLAPWTALASRMSPAAVGGRGEVYSSVSEHL